MRTILKEGKANTHLTHLEELVLTRGEEGYKMAKSFLEEMIKLLRGDGDTKVSTSVKWDGAPAIFAGINPDNGKFFVGTKSIFNKVPKINYTVEDINYNHGHAPGLVDKLKKALYYLPSLGISKILQGDFMFDDGMLEVIDIDGEPHYRFKPNTIIYAVPVNSKLGQQIGSVKFGIVFHTTYDSLHSGASFGADVSQLNRRPDVWFDDAFFKNDTGTVTLTDDDEKRVKVLLKQADAVNSEINYENLPLAKMNIYLNSEIRGGAFADDAKGSYQGFVEWNQNKLTKRINKLKSKKGKEGAEATGAAELEAIESSKNDILNVFKLSRLLFEAKNVFIEKYNNAVYATKHFVDDGSGDLKVTNPEGYVAVDFAGNGVKFVDRLEFSRANFMMDKGFKKPDIKENQMLEIFWNNKKSTKMSLKEWHTLLPKTRKTNKRLFESLKSGKMVTSLIPDSKMVKLALAEAVQWALLSEGLSETVLYLPGGFKPPHKGHFALVRDALERNPGAKLIIMSGESLRDGVSLAQSKKVWDIYFNAIGKADRIEVRELKSEPQYDENGNVRQKPMRGAGTKEPIGGWPADIDPRRRFVAKSKIIRDDDGQPVTLGISTKSPINSIANAIRFTDKPMSSKIVASSADPENANQISRYLKQLGLDVETEIIPVRIKGGDTKMSATDMRRSIGQGMESFSQYLPDELTDEQRNEVFTILGGGLEETSASGGGGGLEGHVKDDEDLHEEREFVNEVIYYLYKQGILK